MPDTDNNPPHPGMQDFKTRGFEHIVDMLRDGNVEDNLEKRTTLFETNGITDRQRELVVNRVGYEYADLVIHQLPRLAIESLRRRILEEERSLESAMIPIDRDNELFQKYLELAGNPEKLGAFVAWMDELAAEGLGQVIYRKYMAGNESQDFFEHTKGLSFELAGCFELGDHSHIYGVSDALEKLKQQLPALDMGFTDPGASIDQRYDVTVVRNNKGEDEAPRMYSVSINQPIGDIKTAPDDFTLAHVAKRADRLVVEPLLPRELRVILGKVRASIVEEHAKEMPNHTKIAGAAEFIKTMLGRYAQTDSPAVVPDATVIYMRSTREFDEEKVLASLGLDNESLGKGLLE